MDGDVQQGEATQDTSALDYSSSAEPRSRSELRGVTGADLSHSTGWGRKRRPDCSLAWLPSSSPLAKASARVTVCSHQETDSVRSYKLKS